MMMMAGLLTRSRCNHHAATSLLPCLALLVACLVTTSRASMVTVAQEDAAIAAINDLIDADDVRIAELVRLAFHDAVGNPGAGRPHRSDGCMNENNGANKGLVSIWTTLNSVYADAQVGGDFGDMSRADFWALAGVVAARRGAANTVVPECSPDPEAAGCIPPLTIRYGRADCDTSPTTEDIGSFPSPHGGLVHVLHMFRDEMGLSEREVVALMGAHSLGGANPNDSGGFRGPWTRQPRSLDRQFYTVLVNRTWNLETQPVPASPTEVVRQWSSAAGGPPSLLMLHTDMCLLRKLEPDQATGEVACGPDASGCPLSQAGDGGSITTVSDVVLEYASDNVAFVVDFAASFTKMSAQGYNVTLLARAGESFSVTALTTPAPTPLPPTTTPPTAAPTGTGNVRPSPDGQGNTAAPTPASGGHLHAVSKWVVTALFAFVFLLV